MRASNQFADAATGVVYIHSSPAAVCPHIEWALAATLDSRPDPTWIGQPADPGLLRTTVNWTGPVGTAARLVDALRVWQMLRFEVTEDPSEGVDGERYSYAPGLGLWRGNTSANGDVTVGGRVGCARCSHRATWPPNCTGHSEPRGTRCSSRTAAAATRRGHLVATQRG